MHLQIYFLNTSSGLSAFKLTLLWKEWLTRTRCQPASQLQYSGNNPRYASIMYPIFFQLLPTTQLLARALDRSQTKILKLATSVIIVCCRMHGLTSRFRKSKLVSRLIPWRFPRTWNFGVCRSMATTLYIFLLENTTKILRTTKKNLAQTTSFSVPRSTHAIKIYPHTIYSAHVRTVNRSSHTIF